MNQTAPSGPAAMPWATSTPGYSVMSIEEGPVIWAVRMQGVKVRVAIVTMIAAKVLVARGGRAD
jgi:hypothetical protein